MSGAVLADLNTGLVSNWSFDDCTAKDNTGNGHDGTLSAAIECPKAVIGNGLRFDGSNFIDLGDMSYLPTDVLTFSMWVKKEQNGGRQGWLGKWNNGGSGDNAFLLYNGEGSYTDYPAIGLSFNSGDGVWYGKTKVPLNNFTHLVFTWSSITGKLRIYQNGKLNASFENVGKGEQLRNGVYSYKAAIANWGYPRGGFYQFVGMLDEIRIYNRALSASEVTALYNIGVSLSGTVKSLSTHTVSCKNETTGQVVDISATKATSYDCEAKGLKIKAGETASIFIKGVAQ